MSKGQDARGKVCVNADRGGVLAVRSSKLQYIVGTGVN